jgi:chromosome segregation ATPase
MESNQSRLQELEQNINDIKIQIKEKEQASQSSQQMIEQQEQQMQQLEAEIRGLEFELQTIRSNQVKLDQARDNVGYKVRKMQSIKKELQSEMQALLAEESLLQVEDGALSEEIDFLQNDIAKFEQRLNEKEEVKQVIDQQLNELEVEHKELIARRDHLIQTGHELEQLNNRNRKLVEMIQQNIGARAQEIEGLDQELVHLTEEKNRLEAELNHLRGESQQYKIQMQSKLAQLASLSEVLNAKQNELSSLQNQTSDAQRDYQKNAEKVDEIKSQIFECQNKIAQFQLKQNDEVQLIQNFETSLAQQVERKNQEIAKLHNLQKSLEQTRKQVEFARRSCHELESINIGLQAEVATLNRQYQTVLSELRTMDKLLGEIKQKRTLLLNERDHLARELISASSVLDRSRIINAQIQKDLDITGLEIEKSKSELTTVAVQIETLQKKEQKLSRLLNSKDEDLNKLHLKINALKLEEKQTLNMINDLEMQAQAMEDLIGKMSQEEKTLEESRGRLARILNGVQKRFEDLKETYQTKTQNIENAKLVAKESIQHIKMQKNAISDLEQKIASQPQTTEAPISQPIQDGAIMGFDSVDRTAVAQHINAISDFCLSTKIDLDFAQPWVDTIQGDEDGALLFHTISMYGKALRVLGAKRMELSISKLEQFGQNHFVLSFFPDQIANIAGIKDVFAKSSQIIKNRSAKLNTKLAHKAKVEHGKLEKIDIIVKFELTNQTMSYKKDHHPWRSSTSSLM